jgi:glucosamine--fructose-6-phosphate aminotransferase (isomerizing)
MEYWGYDSAGIATFDDRFITKKETGKIKELEQKLRFDQLEGTIGIGHTR